MRSGTFTRWSRARWSIPIAALVLVSSGPISAQEEARGEIGVIGGVAGTGQNLAGPDEDFKPGPIVGMRAAWWPTDTVCWFGDLTWARYKTEFAPDDADLYELRSGIELVADVGSTWRRFASVAVGFVSGDLEPLPDGNDLSFDRPFFSVGFGYRRPVGRNAFRWEIRGERTLGDDGLEGDTVTNLHALVGFTWGVGGPPADADADLVPDRHDQCPDTPRGARVDARGCPVDSDEDGVPDGIDPCPNTPRGFHVDARGCPFDADGDGVPDGADGCPSTPHGAVVDEQGCPSDADEDSVSDGIDRCPDTPLGARVDPRGCPLDGDADGIYDGLDACPKTPAGARVDSRGCTVKEEPKSPSLFGAGVTSLVLEGVGFANDSAILTESSLTVLERVAESLRDHPEVRIEVDGHTDSTGSEAYNLALSRRRAAAVEQALIEMRVDPRRITTKGLGESQPVASNATPEGRARNRRVELRKSE